MQAIIFISLYKGFRFFLSAFVIGKIDSAVEWDSFYPNLVFKYGAFAEGKHVYGVLYL